MYYHPKPNEYVKWEDIKCIDKQERRVFDVPIYQYEVSIAKVSTGLIRDLCIFKSYEHMFPSIAHDSQLRPSLVLVDYHGNKHHIPYTVYAMRNFSEEALLKDLKEGHFDLIPLNDDDNI